MHTYHVRDHAADDGGLSIYCARGEKHAIKRARAGAGFLLPLLRFFALRIALVFLAAGCLNSAPIAPACSTADCVDGGDVDAGAFDAAQAASDDMADHHGADAALGFVDGGALLPKWSAQSVGTTDFAVVYGASASDVYLTGLRCTL